jgi:predicted MFS family arabinose efflux permease
MIVGRGLQGAGTGVVPLGISLLCDVMAPEKLSSAIALVSASVGIGAGLGLPIAAAVAQYADWRVLFWGSAGLALAVTAMIWSLDLANEAPAPTVDA